MAPGGAGELAACGLGRWFPFRIPFGGFKMFLFFLFFFASELLSVETYCFVSLKIH